MVKRRGLNSVCNEKFDASVNVARWSIKQFATFHLYVFLSCKLIHE